MKIKQKSIDLFKNYEFIISTSKEVLCSGKGYEYREINLNYLKTLCSILEDIKKIIDYDIESSLKEPKFSTKSEKFIKRSSSFDDLEKSKTTFKFEANYILSFHFIMYIRGRGLEESGYEIHIFRIVDLMIDLKPSLVYDIKRLLLTKTIKSESLKDHLQNIIDDPKIIETNCLRYSR